MRILASYVCAACTLCFVTLLQFAFVVSAAASPLPPPFATAPIDSDCTGNCATNLSGSFRRDGGPPQYRYFIGTNLYAGSLILDFAVPFVDGPGGDFAILTNGQAWGALADTALFEFYREGSFQASFTAALAADQLFQFELPGSGLVVDRVIVTNTTPDPPAVDDLATMTFDAAGAAYLYTAPPTCAAAVASPALLWPPNHAFVPVEILGVADPEGNEVAVTIAGIFQDEAVDAVGSGSTSPDGAGVGTAAAQVRAERAGPGDGRVYHIRFTARDEAGGTCAGEVLVGVPESAHSTPVDGGPLYDSTEIVAGTSNPDHDLATGRAPATKVYLPLLTLP